MISTAAGASLLAGEVREPLAPRRPRRLLVPRENRREPGNPLNGSRPRIGIVDLGIGTSGISRYVMDLLHGLDRRQFDVTLFCRSDGPYGNLDAPGVRVVRVSDLTPASATGAYRKDDVAIEAGAGAGARSARQWLKSAGRRVWRGAMPQPAKYLAGFLRDARRMARHFRDNPVDLLHIQIVSNSHAAVGGRLAGVPSLVGTFHLDPGRTRAEAVVPEMITTKCLDRMIAVSENTRRAWAARPAMAPSRLSVIYNGVDVDCYRRRTGRDEARRSFGVPADASHVMAVVGRLEPQKGHKYVLDAMAAIGTAFPRVHLLLAGGGTIRGELEAQAKALSIADRVHFLGHCRDVQRVIDASDLFVLPSLWEALPFALLEAMAGGLPVVATDVAGVPEVVVHGETGLLVPPADAPALSRALTNALESSGRLRDMGKAGRARIERKFSRGVMLRETEAMYRASLARRR